MTAVGLCKHSLNDELDIEVDETIIEFDVKVNEQPGKYTMMPFRSFSIRSSLALSNAFHTQSNLLAMVYSTILSQDMQIIEKNRLKFPQRVF